MKHSGLDRICSDLASLLNGNIVYSDGTANNRSVGTVAIYNCDTGYNLNGGKTKTCRSDGTWSVSAPTCEGEVLV